MGNNTSKNSSSKLKTLKTKKDKDNNITYVDNRIIDNKSINNNQNNNNNKSNSITSMFGGIKDYFMGTNNTNKNINNMNEYQNKYTNHTVFVRLSAPNYYFANQGLQWVEETMIFDEEG
eukprot:179437_1